MTYQPIDLAAFRSKSTPKNGTPTPAEKPAPVKPAKPAASNTSATQLEYDIAHVECLVQRLEAHKIDITATHADWIKAGFALASLGDAGSTHYHRVCSMYPGYDYDECEQKFKHQLKVYIPRKTNIKTFIYYCGKAGVDTSHPWQKKKESEEEQNTSTEAPAPKPAPARDKSIPYELELQIRQMKRNGHVVAIIVTELSVAKGIAVEKLRPVVEKIMAEKPIIIAKFWLNLCEDEKKDKWKLVFYHNKYITFLKHAGFGMFREGDKFQLVRVTDNIVRHATRKEVKDFIQEYIDSLPFEFDGIYRVELEDKIKREHMIWFAEGTMEWLPDIGTEFHKDDRDTTFFYFRNGFTEVTRNSVKLRPYSQLQRLIWETQILDRDFEKVDMEENESVLNSDFYRFCQNVTGKDPKRLNALFSSMGYLLHRYKVRTHSYAIILCDEAIAKGPSGRGGKGIIVQALNHTRNTVILDGRNFRIENQFAYQRVRHDTNILAYDDLDPKRLPFERLFSILTEGLSVERKQAGEVLIPFEDAPKIIITTNETVIGEGGSYEGRMRELELAPYYSPAFNPEQEFGRILFDDWPEEEWHLFDNIMMHCAQLYMQNGVVRQKQVNLNRRKLIQKTCEEFPEFMKSLKLDMHYKRKQLYQEFIDTYSFDEKQLNARTFNKWLVDWAYYEGLIMSEPEREPNPGPGTYRDYLILFTRALKIAN